MIGDGRIIEIFSLYFSVHYLQSFPIEVAPCVCIAWYVPAVIFWLILLNGPSES